MTDQFVPYPQRIAHQCAETIIRLMKKDGLNWTKEWISPLPNCNAITGHQYTGSNTITTSLNALNFGWTDPRWITAAECKRRGISFKACKATPIFYYKPKQELESEPNDKNLWSGLKWYNVFNLDQLSLTAENCEDFIKLPEADIRVKTQRFSDIDNFISKCGIQIKEANSAFYRKTDDSINIPPIENFKTDLGYYSVLLHEFIHATGVPDRCARQCYADYHYMEKQRAREELVAELGSAQLAVWFGITKEPDINNAAYIKHWVELLEDHPSEIFKAARDAADAITWIKEIVKCHMTMEELDGSVATQAA
jgi:antirestriction protein ArdC